MDPIWIDISLFIGCILETRKYSITGLERTVHMTLMFDLYSEQILVFCYDLEDVCVLSVLFIQHGKCVFFIFVFNIDHLWARLDVVYYALNLFFICKSNH